MTPAGTAAGAAAAAAERNCGVYSEAHVADVDLYFADALQERIFDTEGESVDIEGLVVFRRLIQSQCETRAASAAGGQIDADAGLGLVSEKRFEFLPGRIGKMDHRGSP